MRSVPISRTALVTQTHSAPSLAVRRIDYKVVLGGVCKTLAYIIGYVVSKTFILPSKHTLYTFKLDNATGSEPIMPYFISD